MGNLKIFTENFDALDCADAYISLPVFHMGEILLFLTRFHYGLHNVLC